MKKTESQKRAQSKYIGRGKSIYIFFPEDKLKVYDYTRRRAEKYQIGVATYIKSILENDMKEGEKDGKN